MTPDRHDLTHTTLAVLFLCALIGTALWILQPFIPALIWAAMIVVATWPLMLHLERRLWGKRWLAATLMTLALLFLFVLPLALAIAAIVARAAQIADWVRSLAEIILPPPPDWLQLLPYFGERIAAAWRTLAAAGPQGLAARLEPYASDVLRWIVSHLDDVGLIGMHFLLTVALAGYLYAWGESATAFVHRFARRLAGDRGAGAVVLAGQAIRAVALGVVVTALVQALAGGIGLAVAGVPFAVVLTAAMFFLAVAQIGAGPVLACSTLWLYWEGNTGWAAALLVWTILVTSMDNVLRPILIKQGADLPLLLIFAGVIGGLIAFGFLGIFVGPVVLAVAYTLLDAWVRQ